MLKTRKVERLAEGVASLDLSSNGERMLVQLKRAEPGGDGRRGDARAMGAGAGGNSARGWRRHHRPGGRGSARRSARGVEADLSRICGASSGAISTMLTCMASTPSRWRKNTSHTWKPWPRATTELRSTGNAGRPDGESSARRRRHRLVEPAPRRSPKKLQSGLPRNHVMG